METADFEGKKKMNEVKVYPVSEGGLLQNNFCLRVRPAGGREWQQVQTFQVKVDMHDVREASMAFFDFTGTVEVEITFPKFYTVYQVKIRPLALGIPSSVEPKKITFFLDKPANLAVEINKDRFHNLHLFAGAMVLI